MDLSKALRLIAAIFVCQFVGILGSVFIVSSINSWYSGIEKPLFNPPNWLFVPLWTTLFLLMGISLYLIWEKGIYNRNVKIAVSVFLVQLFLNFLWSFLFFEMQNPFLAFIEIILLWISILATILLFFKLSKKAAALLIPYILWVRFAAILNYSIWVLN